ncbi:TRAP transporter substrate-binding protein [Butyricicoccus faecihominis]|uniref:TRAP transporter substrate-binding protein n=1 Tax=Butyricicoccus faecihominis TaxID=1712515 RepID=UPI002479E1C5|nr:TRAP transporter substrate-binding protein [Butyricicoccus faecihominis]MCQ5130719.1 TRAP transporter substrate-binding protein [Butyricicoccus faecihominis]
MKKQVTALGLSLILGVSLTACGGASAGDASAGGGPSYQWTAANAQPAGGPWDDALIEFSRLLSEKSDGAIQLTVYSGAQLASEKESIEGVQMGTIDFAICSTASLSSFTDSNNVWDLPYLFQDLESARTALLSDASEPLLAALSEAGIKGLSYWENGIYAIGSTKPIRSLDDMKNLRIRAIDSALQADTYTAMGANAVVLAWGDIYTAIQQGVIDAISSTTVVNMHNSNFEEVAPYITLTDHAYSPAPLLMSQTLWDSLPENIRQIVQQAATEAQQYEFRAMDDSFTTAKEKMTEAGAEFIDVDTAAFAAAVQPIYDRYVGTSGIDAATVETLRKAGNQ